MTNVSQTNRILHLFKYQSLVELKTDTEEKEWHRRLESTLKQKIWLHPLSDFNDPFERHFKYVSDPEKAKIKNRCQVLSSIIHNPLNLLEIIPAKSIIQHSYPL
jgi:hypothetical protein